jgi:hypothetical protein
LVCHEAPEQRLLNPASCHISALLRHLARPSCCIMHHGASESATGPTSNNNHACICSPVSKIGQEHKGNKYCYSLVLYRTLCRCLLSKPSFGSHVQAQALAHFGHRLYPRKTFYEEPCQQPAVIDPSEPRGRLGSGSILNCQASHPSGRAVALLNRNGAQAPPKC